MAFKYGTTSPTAIKYNGTDLTVLKYGSTAVWGKPYSLTITKDSYTTVTVNRTSSPNQGASTGNLSNGSVVYYGDVLKISRSPASGYEITSFKVNGLEYGEQITITVTSAITVEAYSKVSKSWKTVWTGSKNLGDIWSYTHEVQVKNADGFTGVVYGRNTRISGTFYWYEENNWGGGTMNYSELEQYQFIYQNTLNTQGNINDFTQGYYSGTPKYCFVTFEVLDDGIFQITARTFYTDGGYWQMISGARGDFKITKVEQYY